MAERDDNYRLFGHLEIIKQDIAFRRIQVTNWAARLKREHMQNSRMSVNSYWMMQEQFSGLYINSIDYLLGNKKADFNSIDAAGVRRVLDRADPGNPLPLISAYERYLTALRKSGLAEIGYQEPTFKDKMRQRT